MAGPYDLNRSPTDLQALKNFTKREPAVRQVLEVLEFNQTCHRSQFGTPIGRVLSLKSASRAHYLACGFFVGAPLRVCVSKPRFSRMPPAEESESKLRL